MVVHVVGERFSLRDKTVDDSTRKALEPNVVMKSGDGFELKVVLSRPAFAYLLQFKANGVAEVLYPSGGDPREAKAQHNIPGEAGVVLQLDDVTGPEVLFLVVSEQPINEAAPEVASLLKEIETMPASSVLPVIIEIQPEVAASVTPAPAPTAVTRATGEPAAKPDSGCAPVALPPSVKATARGCPTAKRPAVKVTARGTNRVRTGKQLIHAVADSGGVLSYAIQIDHQ